MDMCHLSDIIPRMFCKKLLMGLGLGMLISVLPHASAQSSSSSSPKKKPNILLIISDDHAVNALGIKGKSINYLPSLNKLAKEGMVFDRSYCCNSICGPSRAAILTGRHSHKNGFVSHVWNTFDGTQPTYAKMLQANGYQTGYIGKWHLNSDPVGFDYWDIVPGQGQYYSPDFYGTKGKRRIPGYATDIITDLAIDWLDKRDKDKPFMLVVGHKAPHRAWLPAVRHLGKVNVSKLPVPKTLFDDFSDRPEAVARNQMMIANHMSWGSDLKIQMERIPDDLKKIVPKWYTMDGDIQRMTKEEQAAWDKYRTKRTNSLLDGLKPGGKLHDRKAMIEWKWRAYMEDYLAVLLAVDESVGKLSSYIDKKKLDKDTLVIYCSDQSFFLGEHGFYDKRWVFEESSQMPLIMRWKGQIAPGVASQALVQNIDYAPTFADISGSDTSEMGFQGKSLAPLFKTGKADDWRRSLYYAYYEWPAEHNVARHDAVITDRYTIAYLPFTKEWMMFDKQKDPRQMKNVADDPAYKDIVEKLKKEYLDLRKFYDVPDNLPGDTKEKQFPKPSW